MQDTEYLYIFVYFSLIHIRAKNASNAIWDTETHFESEVLHVDDNRRRNASTGEC